MTETNGQQKKTALLVMPGYGPQTSGAGRGLWRASQCQHLNLRVHYVSSSLLAWNFNICWCEALNRSHQGEPLHYFAMLHSDIEPEDFWLDTLIEELEAKNLDVLSAVVPFKNANGLTSTALDRDDGDTWHPLCRLTMREIYNLPETFTEDDTGHPLLLNTGCWVCKWNLDWARQVFFTVNDRVAFDVNLKRYMAVVESEDWFFSRACNDLGLRIGATRKIRLDHVGPAKFSNACVWGDDFDAAQVKSSLIKQRPRQPGEFRFPADVDGWLDPDEGRKLFDLAKGKRVLEIGSYCGRSTICLAQSAADVHTFDPLNGDCTPRPRDTEGDLRLNLSTYGVQHKVGIHREKFTLDQVKSAVATGEYREVEDGYQKFPVSRFDLAFIDGDHAVEAVRADIAAVLELLAGDGLIAFHDYHSAQHPGVTQAVNELLEAGAELVSVTKTLAVVRPAAIPLEV